MTWFGWVYIALTSFGMLSSVGRVGQPRKPIMGGEAMFIVAISLSLIVGVLFVGTGSIQ